jgi:hypothetical protein
MAKDEVYAIVIYSLSKIGSASTKKIYGKIFLTEEKELDIILNINSTNISSMKIGSIY